MSIDKSTGGQPNIDTRTLSSTDTPIIITRREEGAAAGAAATEQRPPNSTGAFTYKNLSSLESGSTSTTTGGSGSGLKRRGAERRISFGSEEFVDRTESMVRRPKTAYSMRSDMLSKISFFMRKNGRAVLATSAFIVFIIIVTSDWPSATSGGVRGTINQKYSTTFGGAVHRGYFTTENSKIDENTFRFAAVTDLDQLSKVTESRKPLFKSLLLSGTLKHDPFKNRYTIQFEEPPRTLTSQHNEAGRGMELSELTMYQDRLFTFDDRTGIVFEILSKDAGKDSYVVPRFVITEGDGDTDKGMKWEWATVKDGELYMGSMGKEYTNPDGTVANRNNLWISILTANGELRRLNWTENYNFVRKALGAQWPGYTINEAILWSPYLKKWVFLPRRVSSEPYDENKDERKGSDKLVLVNENFTQAKVVQIQLDLDPLHGFSTFAFVPGTGDKHALAIRSVEENCVGGDENLCKQKTYFIVFDVLTGEVLMDELFYTEDAKYEGVEFVNIHTPEP